MWLLVCAALVWAMVTMGGVTRLTRSGLSIVSWDPISGALPPLGEDAWARELAAYRETPEGRLVNSRLDLPGFQRIYLIEWTHRQLGRLTGLVVLAPLVWFAATGRLRRSLKLRIAAVFAAGGLQAALGWYMVQSGLSDLPSVSPYRLMAHLLLAVAIFAALLWLALDELSRPAQLHLATRRGAVWLTLGMLVSLGVTISFGALVAGMHAGPLYPSFPSFLGRYVPEGLHLDWPSLTGTPSGVHVMHRLCAAVTCLLAVASIAAALRLQTGQRAALALAVALAVQVLLGALTVLAHVPIALAAVHQAQAVLVLACGLLLLHAQAES